MPSNQILRVEDKKLERYHRRTKSRSDISKAFRLLKKLNGKNKHLLAHTNVSTNEIAH